MLFISDLSFLCWAAVSRVSNFTPVQIAETEISGQISAWRKLYRCRNYANKNDNGKCLVDPNFVRAPDDNILARQINHDHKEALLTSFLLRGCDDARIDGLIWDFNNFTCHDVINDTDFQLDIQAIVGMHSSSAIREAHEAYPNNRDYCYTPCDLYMCPKTPENIAMAHAWGNVQNKIANQVLPMTAFDYMKQCRTVFVNIQKKYSSSTGATAAVKKRDVTAKLKQLSTAWSLPPQSVQQYWGISNRSDLIWNNIAKVFSGEVQHSTAVRFIKPTTLTHFVFMAKVPDVKIVYWLDCMVRQDPQCRSTKQFMVKCVWYKKSIVIQQAVLGYMAVKHGSDYQDWDDLTLKQPWATPEWFSDQVAVCPDKTKRNATLPLSVKNSIDNKIAQEEKAAQVYIVVVVCCTYLYIYIYVHIQLTYRFYVYIPTAHT